MMDAHNLHRKLAIEIARIRGVDLAMPERRCHDSRHALALKGVSSAFVADEDIAAHGKHVTVIFSGDNLTHRESLIVVATLCDSKGGARTVSVPVADTKKLRSLGVNAQMMLKHAGDIYEARSEAMIHLELWSVFAAAGRLSASALHRRVCALHVKRPNDSEEFPLMPMRRFTCSAQSVRPSSADLVVAIARAAADTLSVMHRASFVHLDVKPSNILLMSKDSAAQAVLSDYETVVKSAVLFDEMQMGAKVKIYAGTTRYMSPLLTLSTSSVFRQVCLCAGLSHTDARVGTQRKHMTSASRCDMHSLAVTMFDIAGPGLRSHPSVKSLIHAILVAPDATKLK